MQTPSKKAIRSSKGMMNKKSVALLKKARKQMRKLYKASVKNDDTTALALAEKMLDVINKAVDLQKKLRTAETASEPKK